MSRTAFRPSVLPALAVALLAGALASTHAAALESGSGQRVAVVLFLSYHAGSPPRTELADMQRKCWDQLTTDVHDLGHSVASRSEIEPVMRRGEVRTDLNVSRAFLAEVAADLDAGVLLVCTMTVDEDRLLLCGRDVETSTGKISWADIVEQRLPPESEFGQDSLGSRWRVPAAAASRRLLDSWNAHISPVGFSGDLFVVPVRTIGTELTAGRLVLSCLLRSLVESHWRIEEPGVTFSRLRESGVDPRRLDRTSRPTLTAAGAHGAVLVCNLVADDNTAPGDPFPSGEGTGPARPPASFPQSTISIRLLDIDSGVVVFAATERLDMRQVAGLFGTLKDASPVERLQPVADRLVRAAIRKG